MAVVHRAPSPPCIRLLLLLLLSCDSYRGLRSDKEENTRIRHGRRLMVYYRRRRYYYYIRPWNMLS